MMMQMALMQSQMSGGSMPMNNNFNPLATQETSVNATPTTTRTANLSSVAPPQSQGGLPSISAQGPVQPFMTQSAFFPLQQQKTLDVSG